MSFWTNASVLALAGDEDPETVVSAKAEELALAALSDGWTGPPYDPFELARRLDIPVVARDDLYDARIVPGPGTRFTLEYNPSRPRGRVRFSVAHELAHTLFPDASEQTRYRDPVMGRGGDDWQVEMLCNIAASELLMPTGAFPQLRDESLDIEHLMALRREYDVSTEALLLRVARLAQEPVTMFSASRHPHGDAVGGSLRIDYWRAGRAGGVSLRRGARIARSSVAYDCTAAGYTAKGIETWQAGPELRVEAVGVPPYPGHRMPRVLGMIRTVSATAEPARPGIEYVTGDALDARGDGPRVIVHVVNDRTSNWGGGFARALRDRYPAAQSDFRDWVGADKTRLRMGAIRTVRVDRDLRVATLIAQKGYGPSEKPRIRYEALREALREFSGELAREPAAVHMPRIGAGMAGGDWAVIAELVDDELVGRGHPVVVYSLPNADWRPVRQAHEQQALSLRL